MYLQQPLCSKGEWQQHRTFVMLIVLKGRKERKSLLQALWLRPLAVSLALLRVLPVSNAVILSKFDQIRSWDFDDRVRDPTAADLAGCSELHIVAEDDFASWTFEHRMCLRRPMQHSCGPLASSLRQCPATQDPIRFSS
jgi:hypothetical protein